MNRRRALGGALVLVPSLFVSSIAFAGDPVAAREQVKLGYTLAQDGKCEEAIPHFVESLRLDAKAITLINLASCEEKTNRLSEALGHWVDARARAQTEGNSPIEEEAERRAKALEPKLPKLTVVVPGAPGDVEVMRDGVTLGAASLGVPLPVNPGAHVLVVHAKGHADTSESVSLSEAESKSVSLAVGAAVQDVAVVRAPGASRDEPGRGVTPLVLVGFGVALVGVGVGSVTGILSFGKASTARDDCTGHVCNQTGLEAVDSGRTLSTISTVAFIAAGVGAAVGIAGLVVGKPRASATFAVSVGPLGGAVRGAF